MQNKHVFKWFLFILFVYFFSVNYVNASVNYDFNVIPDKNVVSKNKTINFSFNIKSYEVSEGIIGCRFSVIADEEITILRDSLEIDSNNWTLEESEDVRNYILKVKETPLLISSENNNNVVLTLPFKVANSGNVTIKNIACYKSEEDYEEKNDIEVSLKVSDLSSIKINDKEMIESDTNFYNETNINAESFNLEILATDDSMQDSIKVYALDLNDSSGSNCENNVCTKNKELTSCQGGSCSINYADNYTVKKVLDSANNFKEVKLAIYLGDELIREQLIIQKEIKVSTVEDLALSSIIINNKIIQLEDGITTYDIILDKDTNNVLVEAILSDSENAMFDENNKPGEFDYQVTMVNLIVRSKTGTSYKTYTINISYEDSDPSSSNPSSSSSSSSSSQQTIVNPQTGGMVGLLIGFMLIVSLGVSFIIYQNNVNKEIE